MNFNQFFNELRRRNVFKGAISYLVFSWVLLQVITIVGPMFNAPAWVAKIVLVLLIVLFPVWVTISWFFEVTEDGIKKTTEVPLGSSITKKTGRKLSGFIIVFLFFAVVLLFVDRFRIKAQAPANIDATIENFEASKNSIAVLPFKDLSPNKDQEYFADGLTEEILNSLAQIPELEITSRTSSFSFKGKNESAQTIAKKLHVNYLVEGSVRYADSTIRVSMQLIDIINDKSMWSKTWTQELKDLFEIQNSIAQAVAKTMELSIVDNLIPTNSGTDPNAYGLYLKANYNYLKQNYSSEEKAAAENLLQQSLVIDPNYAPSWILLGKIYYLQLRNGDLEYEDGINKINLALSKAQSLDPNNAQVYNMLSKLAIDFDKDLEAAKKYSEKALKIAPTNDEILDTASGLALLEGKLDKAIALGERAAKLDPVDAPNFYNLGIAYYYANELEKAEENIKASIELDPESYGGHYFLCLIYLLQDRLDMFQDHLDKEQDEGWRLHAQSLLEVRRGQKEALKETMAELILKFEGDMDYQIAATYAFDGQADASFLWLEKAFQNDDLALQEINIEPLFRKLHDDKRWLPFIKKIAYK